MLTGARQSILHVRSSIVGTASVHKARASLAEVSHISAARRRVSDSSRLTGLGVRDIPMYSNPLFDVARIDRVAGHVPLNRIVVPSVLRE